MAEAIHCPSCTTRYRLRPERLKPAIRRAKCLSCGGVFPVGDIVQRLLALPAPAATAVFAPALVASVQHPERPSATATTPSLTLSDLGSADVETLESTLITAPEPLPEVKAALSHSFPKEITETTLSGYTSARDAIEKLFGSSPTVGTAMKISQEPAMDMEATMSALDNTLGAPPDSFSAGARESHGDGPTSSGLPAAVPTGPSSSTLRISQEDLLAAISYQPTTAPTPAPVDPTQPLRAPDLEAPSDTHPTALPATPAPRTFAPLPETSESGAELLRLKIGEDIYGGLTMPQLIAWVEEGRILENHLVARQHSENWLEAHKVPGLRPVFDRLRRDRTGGAPSLGAVEAPPKKSLFGGLFGRN